MLFYQLIKNIIQQQGTILLRYLTTDFLTNFHFSYASWPLFRTLSDRISRDYVRGISIWIHVIHPDKIDVSARRQSTKIDILLN